MHAHNASNRQHLSWLMDPSSVVPSEESHFLNYYYYYFQLNGTFREYFVCSVYRLVDRAELWCHTDITLRVTFWI